MYIGLRKLPQRNTLFTLLKTGRAGFEPATGILTECCTTIVLPPKRHYTHFCGLTPSAHIAFGLPLPEFGKTHIVYNIM